VAEDGRGSVLKPWSFPWKFIISIIQLIMILEHTVEFLLWV
jgi:hypothetical protein